MKDRDAIMGGSGMYRYVLSRHADPAIEPMMAQRLLWIMLNPSTADAQYDDATIRKCMSFSRTWGFGVMRVVNLYAYRATDPRDLWDAQASGTDIVGPSNDNYIRDMGRWSGEVCIAWGAGARFPERADHVISLLDEVTTADRIFFIDLAKNSQPVHPLYQKLATPRKYVGDAEMLPSEAWPKRNNLLGG